ncbi:hypothetical protein SFR_5099 [Streptomyces sp. FR-008]|nr:hypothetical protein SFR_5099 [Streptomyces sp. FR-008]
MAGEPQAAALGVAQTDPLHRRRGRRPYGLSLTQCRSVPRECGRTTT